MYISSLQIMCLYLYGMSYLFSHSLCQKQGATRGARWTAAAVSLSLSLWKAVMALHSVMHWMTAAWSSLVTSLQF